MVLPRYYSDLAGEEAAKKYQTLIYLAGSASAEFIADIALCPFEAVKVRRAVLAAHAGRAGLVMLCTLSLLRLLWPPPPAPPGRLSWWAEVAHTSALCVCVWG